MCRWVFAAVFWWQQHYIHFRYGRYLTVFHSVVGESFIDDDNRPLADAYT